MHDSNAATVDDDPGWLTNDIIGALPIAVLKWRLLEASAVASLTLVAVNAAAARHFALVVDASIGKTIDALFPEMMRTELPRLFAEVAMAGGARKVASVEGAPPHERWTSITAFALPDGCVGVTFEDVTHVKTTKAMLEARAGQRSERTRVVGAESSVFPRARKLDAQADVGPPDSSQQLASEEHHERRRVQEALRRETEFVRLLGSIAVAANQADRLEEIIQTTLGRVCRHTGWPVGHAYMPAADGMPGLLPTSIWHIDDPERFERFRTVTETTRLGVGEGLPGRVLATGKPVWLSDVTVDNNFPRAELALNLGVRAAFAFPVLTGSEVVAVLEFFATELAEPDERLLDVMAHIGTQLGRVAERERTRQQHQLAGVVAHDLRSPLSIIMMRAAMLDKCSDAERRVSTRVIIRSSERMNRIIDDLTDYSRVRVGLGIPMRPTLVDLDDVCRSVVTELEGLYAGRNISFQCDGDGHGTWDPERMGQVFQNLLTNAMKYGIKGTLVRTRRYVSGDMVVLEVHNEGKPIAPAFLPYIFDPFRRGTAQHDGKRSAGLGLFIVQSIVEAHGGSITVHSTAEDGTTFTVALPRGGERA